MFFSSKDVTTLGNLTIYWFNYASIRRIGLNLGKKLKIISKIQSP